VSRSHKFTPAKSIIAFRMVAGLPIAMELPAPGTTAGIGGRTGNVQAFREVAVKREFRFV
jgi:hypothetical protein